MMTFCDAPPAGDVRAVRILCELTLTVRRLVCRPFLLAITALSTCRAPESVRPVFETSVTVVCARAGVPAAHASRSRAMPIPARTAPAHRPAPDEEGARAGRHRRAAAARERREAGNAPRQDRAGEAGSGGQSRRGAVRASRGMAHPGCGLILGSRLQEPLQKMRWMSSFFSSHPSLFPPPREGRRRQPGGAGQTVHRGGSAARYGRRKRRALRFRAGGRWRPAA